MSRHTFWRLDGKTFFHSSRYGNVHFRIGSFSTLRAIYAPDILFMVWIANVARVTLVMDTKTEGIVSNVLSTQLLKEILAELSKSIQDETLRRRQGPRQGRLATHPVNRDKLLLFLHAERLRLTEAAVDLRYTILPKLLTPGQSFQRPFNDSSENHVAKELTQYIVRRDELKDRFQTFLTQSRAKTPVHKQDHEPVRRCVNPKCNNIALFKHSPDSLVCVSCGTKQSLLENNIAYGEEILWQSSTEHKSKSSVTSAAGSETEPVTVERLLQTPYLLQQTPKAYDLSYMFHFDVESPPNLAASHSVILDDMKEFLRNDPECKRLRGEWKMRKSNDVYTRAMLAWKSFLKDRQFKFTPVFACHGTFAMLEWVPRPVPKDVHAQLSQSLYLFCTALLEYQTAHPEHAALQKVKKANFRKFILHKLLDKRPELAVDIRLFLPALKLHDKQYKLYESCFSLLCHHVESLRSSEPGLRNAV